MMKKLLFSLCSVVFLTLSVQAQLKQPLTYFLPDINYDKGIPTPEEFLGYQIGEWHLSHDQQLAYMRRLAELSPRVKLQEIGRTYEGRPTINLIITSEKNHENLEEIKAQHLALSDPTRSAEVDAEDVPTVLYQGYSIHGNEASGGNAAPLAAYYLAAGKGRDVEDILDNVVVIFDPCYNPDGFNRFSSWVNVHKNKNETAISSDREYNEAWPRGRTNHYWFDLNRDWMPLQHPESQGRLQVFHDWKPNVLTDHHEMGTNATFFFMPGEPTRVHPITPARNQELTEAIAKFHVTTLDEIGSLYYSKEGYDDFYYGKGSTYPDANGCIGILFEQASARGHIQESDNGLLTFPFAIRNQVRTALSTYQACVDLGPQLNEYQRNFYLEALQDAQADNRKAFVFGEPFDKARTDHFIEILRRHQIDVYELGTQVEAEGKTFSPEHSFIVPTEQTQYRFIRGLFETLTTFEDSLFYDISAWTMPMAFNIPFAAINGRYFNGEMLGDPVTGLRPRRNIIEPDYSEYAYVFGWEEYYAPKAANYLLSQGLRLDVANEPFVANGRRFNRGSIIVPLQNQGKDPDLIYQLIRKASRDAGVAIYDIDSGWTPAGPDLGSRTVGHLRKPEVLLIIGDGVSSYDAGEVWHLLDQRYDMVLTKVDVSDLGRADLDRFNTLIMVNGSYNSISSGTVDRIRDWVRAGGTLIGFRGAIPWLNRQKIGKVNIKKPEEDKDQGRRPYAMARRDRGGAVVGGAIFEAEADLSHPLLYGYRRDRMPIFRRGTLLLEPAENPYATPLLYTQDPLLSGYINRENLGNLGGTASIVVSGAGSGRVIFMADNTNFRAFWYGTNKLFANAIFFGHTISGSTIER